MQKKILIVLTTLIICLVLAIVGVLGFIWYTEMQSNTEPQTNPLIMDAYESRLRGEYGEAYEALKSLLTHEDETVRLQAFFLLTERDLEEGDEEEIRAVIEELKTIIANVSNTPHHRSATTAFLFDWYRNNLPQSEQYFDQIFDGAPFEHLVPIAESKKHATKLAVEMMQDISPTVDGGLWLAGWYAIEVLENAELDAITRDLYIDNLWNLSKDSWNLKLKMAVPDAVALYDSIDYNYAWSRSFHVALLEKYGISETGNGVFNRFLAIAESEIGNSTSEEFHKFLSESIFYQAAFLDLAFGESRTVEIQSNLDRMMPLLEANDDNFVSWYIADHVNSSDSVDYRYDFFVRMAEYSPEFKQYLDEKGFVFDTSSEEVEA